MSYQQPNSWQTPRSAADFDSQAEWQRRQDADHLNLLSIFYYINAGLHVVSTFVILGYFGVFGMLIGQGAPELSNSDAAVAGSILLTIGGFATLLNIAFTVLLFYAAKALKTHQSTTAIYIAAGLSCLSVPFGTALGVFTFIVMNRPSVRDLFSPDHLSGLYESNRYR